MSKLMHALGHGVLLVLQYANAASKFVPVKYQPVVAAGLALVQGILALVNHKSPVQGQ